LRPPAASDDVVILACPLKLTGTFAASVVVTGVNPFQVKSVKVTLPFGAGTESTTVAVNLTGLPDTV
jgi:hypothetical protein